MNFSNTDLGQRRIKNSFQDLLQRYYYNNTCYILDGRGNVVFHFPSSSINTNLSNNNYSYTSSYSVVSLTSSYSLNFPNLTGTTQQITSSWSTSSLYSYESIYALSSSYVNYSEYSNTSSISADSVSSSYSVYSEEARFISNNGISIPKYDYSNVFYNGPNGQISSCVYKFGGENGAVVSTITSIYSGSMFVGISKSLG